ncbi:MAG: hypothetical protein Q7R89_00745 [bacterium]|nr:hypothetical protein [bacterium]
MPIYFPSAKELGDRRIRIATKLYLLAVLIGFVCAGYLFYS